MDEELMETDLTHPFSPPPLTDISTHILTQYGSSNHEPHRQLCLTVGTITQSLTEQNIPLTPISFLGATISSLNSLACSLTPSSTSSLLTFLSFLLPTVSVGILKKKKMQLLEMIVKGDGKQSLVGCDGRVSLVKCVGFLLALRDGGASWGDVEGFYGFLLTFVTDSDSKVRREAHVCVRDVLQSFQGSPFLAPASEGFTNIFTKLLLLAGSSKEKGAQEILHVLEALKDCLPYFSKKYKNSILKHYKTLLALRQPLVTRRITDSLNVLCLHHTSEVSPELLVDLLASLAQSVHMDETSADDMTFAARLLDVGMRKVYNLNRQTCVDKLPVILNSLQDILGSGFEEAKFAASEALKNLIQACIDEELIKLGVNRVKNNSELQSRKSPSVIEKICATIGSLLDNRYRDEWDLAFQIVALMFDKFGESSSILLRGTLKSLASIEKESETDFPERKQLQECVGSALQAMGPDVFLSILPLNLKAGNPVEINAWLFPVLKQYTVGARLRFYVESLLGAIPFLKEKSHQLKLDGRLNASRDVDSVVYTVWLLLPSFCNYSLDTSESFKLLEKVLCKALSEEPDLRGVICSSLLILIQQNKSFLEGQMDADRDKTSHSFVRVIGTYNQEVASANLKVLRSSAQGFFTVLSRVFFESSNDPGGSLQATIAEFASIADKGVVTKFFLNTMHKLLKVTQEAGAAKADGYSMQIDSSDSDDRLSKTRAKLLDLAVSLLPGLALDETDVLFKALVTALKDADGLVQKKAYKVLSAIFKNSDEFIARKLDELLKLMIEVLPSCHFSAKRHRLDCLYYLIVHVAKGEGEQRKGEIISSFLTEIVLALKEANKKTRNRAYDILVEIGHACGDEDKGGTRENLFQFFNMVACGLTGETPHMISAAVKGLARLAYEFSDLICAAYNVLPSSFLLLKRKNREISKANLGLVKVLVAKSPAENVQDNLKVMVEGLLNWQDETKKHFKAKIKHLLEMLVKKCGLEAVKAVMPEEHMKLLTNVRKIKERRERKLSSNSETGSFLSKATTSRQSEWRHTKVFSDVDEDASDGDYLDAGTSIGRRSMISKSKSRVSSLRSRTKSARTLSDDALLGDEPLDLLDQQKTRLALRSAGQVKRKRGSDEEPEFDDDGRLIVREEGNPIKEQSSDNESDDDRSQAGSYASRKSDSKNQKRRKTSDSGWAYTGREYASKKARGDVKKKGKLEPYAYWPLDRKMLSRRPEHRAAARRGMSSVVRLTKRLEGKSVASALSLRSKSVKKKVHHKKGGKKGGK